MSLMAKIMLTVNITTILLILCFSYFLENFSEEKLEEATKMQMTTLLSTIKLTTADFIWNINNEALKNITDKLIKEESISSNGPGDNNR